MGRVFVHLWIQHCGSSQERYFTPPPRGSGPTSRRALRLASSRGAADNDSFNSCMPPGRERRADSGAPHGLRMGSSPRHRDSRARAYERALSGLGLGAVPPRPARGGTHIVADRSDRPAGSDRRGRRACRRRRGSRAARGCPAMPPHDPAQPPRRDTGHARPIVHVYPLNIVNPVYTCAEFTCDCVPCRAAGAVCRRRVRCSVEVPGPGAPRSPRVLRPGTYLVTY